MDARFRNRCREFGWAPRFVTNWAPDPQGAQYGAFQWTEKGYTGHEHLDNVYLIQMQGRVQDPVTGVMWSADPLFGDTGNPQSLSPYSYVLNSPVTLTDPSGFQAVQPGWSSGPISLAPYGIQSTLSWIGSPVTWTVGDSWARSPTGGFATPGMMASAAGWQSGISITQYGNQPGTFPSGQFGVWQQFDQFGQGHAYRLTEPYCLAGTARCTEARVNESVLRFVGPGMDGGFVAQSGSVYRVNAWPGGGEPAFGPNWMAGDIRVLVTRPGFVVNETLLDHPFCCGRVTQETMLIDGFWSVQITGSGLNLPPVGWFNSALGPAIFQGINEQRRNWIQNGP